VPTHGIAASVINENTGLYLYVHRRTGNKFCERVWGEQNKRSQWDSAMAFHTRYCCSKVLLDNKVFHSQEREEKESLDSVLVTHSIETNPFILRPLALKLGQTISSMTR
jgi:hypothetical protein